jgi:hypothetical protein
MPRPGPEELRVTRTSGTLKIEPMLARTASRE